MEQAFYLGWVDRKRRKAVVKKILEAARAYERRFGRLPAEVLVAPEEVVVVEGITVRPVDFLRPGNYWAGPIEDEQIRSRFWRREVFF